MPTPIIDLFAGPGGLGEGFSAFRRAGKPVFKIGLSIEKDRFAHQTLQLRSFFRQFADGTAPQAYYDHLAGLISREQLFEKAPAEAANADKEAWCAELGSDAFPADLIDARIQAAIGNSTNWVLIGGPPCQAYSLVGRSRRKNDPTFATDEKHRLYEHYLRILAVHRPPVFVMENVKGLLSAKVDGESTFSRILSDLESPREAVDGFGQRRKTLKYQLVSLVVRNADSTGHCDPGDFVVRAEDYGIPQTRHRIIILGIRGDIHGNQNLLKSGPPVPIEMALGDLPILRSGLSKENDSPDAWLNAVQSIRMAKWLSDPIIDITVRKEVMRSLNEMPRSLDRGSEFIGGKPAPMFAPWPKDQKLRGFCNHSSRGHIRADLHRYMFVAAFGAVHKRSPGLEEFPNGLLPKHANIGTALTGTLFNDRFRVQVKGRPSTTVVSHIAKDGHYFIHYDSTQCRSLTVREAARLQTFPDNYFFEGPRTEQYRQVGNAVPPRLAVQIAEIVNELLRSSNA
jgi:DNA (cytosine-5)-methyltransferase 1